MLCGLPSGHIADGQPELGADHVKRFACSNQRNSIGDFVLAAW